MLALYQIDAPKPAPSAADKLRAMAVDQRARGKS
jgi:hypothetical protein